MRLRFQAKIIADNSSTGTSDKMGGIGKERCDAWTRVSRLDQRSSKSPNAKLRCDANNHFCGGRVTKRQVANSILSTPCSNFSGTPDRVSFPQIHRRSGPTHRRKWVRKNNHESETPVQPSGVSLQHIHHPVRQTLSPNRMLGFELAATFSRSSSSRRRIRVGLSPTAWRCWPGCA